MPTTTASSKALLEELDRKPNDLALREQAARALQREGDEAGAITLLTGALRNLTAHEPPPLPCLCKRCLEPALKSAEAGGLAFDRDFAVAAGRVLFYWVPREVRRKPGLRRSVQAKLEDTLKEKAKRRKRS